LKLWFVLINEPKFGILSLELHNFYKKTVNFHSQANGFNKIYVFEEDFIKRALLIQNGVCGYFFDNIRAIPNIDNTLTLLHFVIFQNFGLFKMPESLPVKIAITQKIISVCIINTSPSTII